MAGPRKESVVGLPAGALAHGALDLPCVTISSYNIEQRAGDGFLGDRANKGAFWSKLETWRERLRDVTSDPLGGEPGGKINKKALDDILAHGDGDQAGVVLGAIEDFAGELANVLSRFLKEQSWQGVERIVVGGGMRGSRVGEVTIGRAGVLLKASGATVDLEPIRHDPDEAGLIGASQLLPTWMLKGHGAFLAADIGGTNMRAGVVELKIGRSGALKDASVWKSRMWRHADEAPSRGAAMDRLAQTLRELTQRAGDAGLDLAPVIGVGCPGVIAADGSIVRGGQNLPGKKWESPRFNLPRALRDAIPRIGRHETEVILHNYAVVQGLSQAPFMADATRWGVVTIGTGLGNACFVNKSPAD